MTRTIKALLVGAALSVALAACGAPGTGGPGSGTLQVIAGENFWGSIAAQLGGSHVSVTSIVTNPNTDPHEYESSPTYARAFATANYPILNRAAYDNWRHEFLSANPRQPRKLSPSSDLPHTRTGHHPHFC